MTIHRSIYIFRIIIIVVSMFYNILSGIQVFTGASVNQIFTDARLKVIFYGLAFVFMGWWIIEKEVNEYLGKHSKPVIKLQDFGLEKKDWSHLPPSVVAFIKVFNEPRDDAENDVNAKSVYATVVWEDEEGKEVDRNPGRWFIPNQDQEGAIGLQTVDLDANGLPRKLHFTYIAKDFLLHSLWRTDDGYMQTKAHTTSSSYRIRISLRDNKGTKADFYFRIVPYQIQKSSGILDRLRLEKLSIKNGKVIDTKYNDLSKTLDKID